MSIPICSNTPAPSNPPYAKSPAGRLATIPFLPCVLSAARRSCWPLVLYPYVYLLARTAFATQAAAMFEAARVLGASPRRAFYGIALPAARPAIAGGLALVLMETVADYGVVDYFGVATFTTGIFRTWFALGDRDAAMQLAGLLFLLVAVLVVAEHYGRRGRFDNPVSRNAPPPREVLKGSRALLAMVVCLAPVVLGFVVPFAVLAQYAVVAGDPLLGRSFGDFVQASFGVAGVTALIAAGLALWLVSAQRTSSGPVTRFSVRVATLGYALPGAMLAVGLLVPLTALRQGLGRLFRPQFRHAGGSVADRHGRRSGVRVSGALPDGRLQLPATPA